MLRETIKVSIPANFGGPSVVELAGVDVANAVTGLVIEAPVGHIPKVTLDVMVREVAFDGEALVSVDPYTHSLLVRLGWTPPAVA